MKAYTIKSNGGKIDFLDKVEKFTIDELNKDSSLGRKIYLRLGMDSQDLRDKICGRKSITLDELMELSAICDFDIIVMKEYK